MRGMWFAFVCGLYILISNAAAQPPFSQFNENSSLIGLYFDSPSERDSIENKYSEFQKFLLGQLSDDKLFELIDHCSFYTAVDRNPFCFFIHGVSRKGINHHDEKKNRIKYLKGLLDRADHRGLAHSVQATVSEYLKALGKKRSLKYLKKLAEGALEKPDCKPAALLTALALRLEDGFPSDEYVHLSMDLYKKATECEKGTTALEANYRLGLLNIYYGDCQKAEKYLSNVLEIEDFTEFRLRGMFWRRYCAKEMGQLDLQKSLEEKLKKEFPLSHHNLTIEGKKWAEQILATEHEEPTLLLRTEYDLELNYITRAIEILDVHGQKQEARRLLVHHLNRALSTEGAFQLYWAILSKRLHLEMASFQLISSAVKVDSHLWKKKTLTLMYPLIYLEFIRDVSPQVDPLLVLSLIRQESAFNPQARSPAGALGLMQLEPRTAKLFARLSKDKLLDPQINIRGGVLYLQWLINRFEGNLDLALASYNAGPARIKEMLGRYPTGNLLLFMDLLPLKETREYVSSIARNYFWYLVLYTPRTAQPPGDISKFQIMQFLSSHN